MALKNKTHAITKKRAGLNPCFSTLDATIIKMRGTIIEVIAENSKFP
jgi:hypothetical protein